MKKTSPKIPAWPKDISRYFKIKLLKRGFKYEITGPVLQRFKRLAEAEGADVKEVVDKCLRECARRILAENKKA